MNNKEMSEFIRKLRNRNEMPIDKDEYYILEDIAERLSDIHGQKNEIIRCKDCKYHPVPTKQRGVFGGGSGLEFPVDFKCPCQCDDPYYSWIPKDDWFCADGERKEDNSAE